MAGGASALGVGVGPYGGMSFRPSFALLVGALALFDEIKEARSRAVFFDQDQLVVELAAYFKTYGFSTNRVRSVIAF